jgi:thiol:disulfide interchange protein DsbD
MRNAVYSTLLILLAVAASAAAANFPGVQEVEPRFLPVDEAFQLSATRRQGFLEVRWFVMPGYYLYRKSLAFKAPGNVDLEAHVPDGEPRHDEYFGDVEVYHDELIVEVQVYGDEIEIWYQGCAEAGYCYPPQKKRLNVAKMQGSGQTTAFQVD